MRRRLLAFVLISIASFAFQDSLSSLKLTRQTFENSVTNYVTQELSDAEGSLALPFIGSTSRPLFLAMNDSARAAVVRELGLAAKALVMSPAFTAAYNAKLKAQYNAIDHGLKVTDTSAALNNMNPSTNPNDMMVKIQAMMRDQLRQMVLGQQAQIASFDGPAVKEMAESIESQMDSIPPTNPAEKAMHAKALALLRESKKLSATDVAAAREKFRAGSLFAVYVDGNNAAGAQVDQTKKEQQLNYDKRALRPNLKRHLLAFVAEAKTVDFKAVTQAKGSKTVFVNPAFERKSPMWKLIYRLGPGGSAAAIAVAQAWAAEL